MLHKLQITTLLDSKREDRNSLQGGSNTHRVVSALYKVRPKSFETSCFKRVLCVISSGRHHNYIVLCFM